MPKTLERKLKAQARKKGFKGKRADAYVYGTLRKTGWTPSTQKHSSPKGSAWYKARIDKKMGAK